MSASPDRTIEQSDLASAPASFKRRRTALACGSCRVRKTRCNGERPLCKPCTELGLECIYENPANGNARFQQPTHDERLKNIEDTLRLLVQAAGPSRQAATSRPALDRSVSSTHFQVQDGQRLAGLQDDATIFETEDDTVEDGMASYTDPNDAKARFYGPSSNIAFLRGLSAATTYTLKDIEGQNSLTDQTNTRPLISRLPSPANTPSTMSVIDHISAGEALVLPPEPHAVHLIELFFNETGMLFPFIQQGYVVSSYNYAAARGFTGIRRSFLCLLNAIFAMATHLDDSPGPGSTDAETFYQRANLLFEQIELRMHNVETVQSLLLMIQYRQGTQKSDDTWILLGKAVRIALQLGLHSRSAALALSPVDIEVRKRVWLNCVSLDRVLSMTFGRPQTISEDYVRMDLPLNTSLDTIATAGHSASPYTDTLHSETVCFFTATIQLYDVLNFILATIYDHNLGPVSPARLPEVLKHGISIEQKLLQWRIGLPPELQRRPWISSTDNITYTVFDKLSAILHLRYLNVSLLHQRAIIDQFLVGINTGHSNGMSPNVQEPFLYDFAWHTLRTSQDSAMEVVDVVWRMSQRPGALGAWWFSAYYSFNACLVLYGCILVLFGLSRQQNNDYQIEDVTRMQQRMSQMINSLSTGVKIIKRIGKGTRTAKGVHRTLIKIIQISTRLAQLLAQTQLANVIANPTSDLPAVEPGNVQTQLLQPEPLASTLNQPSLFQDDAQYQGQWSIPDLQYWTAQTDLDIFADLGSLDAGLGSFMAA